MPTYETQAFEFLPPDKYHLAVDSIEETTSTFGGQESLQLQVTFFVKGGPKDGKKILWWCGRGTGLKWMELWAAFGIDAKGRKLATEKLYGKECDALIGIGKKNDGVTDKQTIGLIPGKLPEAKKEELVAVGAGTEPEDSFENE